MTIKELIKELNNLTMMIPASEDYEVVMVGYDANGERHYDISMDDVTLDCENKKLMLWDF